MSGTTEYQIQTDRGLDRETQSIHRLILVCQDGGSPPLWSQATFDVEVTDVNDNTPRFDQPTYSADVLENNYLGVVLVRLRASDADFGVSAKITYQLESLEYGRYFDVDYETGVLVAKTSLDHELNAHFRFHVLAVDGTPQHRTGMNDLDGDWYLFNINHVLGAWWMNDGIRCLRCGRYM